jgi:hypothetical protein
MPELTDQQKTVLAKKRYETFMKKMERQIARQPIEFQPTYVFVNNQVKDDYYWGENRITPTAFYRWLKETYNKTTIPKKNWATKVVLADNTFDTLISMIENANHNDVLVFDDVTVIPSRARGRK